MAAFCTKCGAALGAGAFCTSCGAPVAPAAAAPAAPAPAPAAPAPSQGGSNVLKIVLIIVGILALLIILCMGTCFYVAYRAKNKIQEFTQAPANTRPYQGKKDACSLISASEVGEAVGEPAEVVPESSSSAACHFKYGTEGGKVVNVTFTWQGGAFAMKLMHAALEHGGQSQGYQTIEGVGDEAYVDPVGSELLMRKGDVMVNIVTSATGTDAAKKIAGTIAGRL